MPDSQVILNLNYATRVPSPTQLAVELSQTSNRHQPHCQKSKTQIPLFSSALTCVVSPCVFESLVRRCSHFDAAEFAFLLPFGTVPSLILLLPLLLSTMPSQFLKCTICPKRQTFSDVSHLLTHVGSKGHLSHLHKLQVKSHQELAAAHSLAIYNQWFQEHGVAALLSERMQQKDQRRAEKKSANEARLSAVYGTSRSRRRKSTTAIQQPPAASAYEPQPPTLKSRVSDEDFGDLDYTPAPASR